MIKKIILIMLAVICLQGFAFAQDKNDQRTLTTRIADLLAQLPAKDAKQLKANMLDISAMGEDGYVTLISGLTAPGKGNNALLEYAIDGFTAYVSQQGQENLRKMSVSAYGKALDKLSDSQNKAFIISQLELVGRDDAISYLTGYLTNNELADPAARALVKINSSASKATLLAALAKANNTKAQLSVIEALGHTKLQEAAQAIATLVRGSNQEALTKVGLFALANIADPSAENILSAAATKNGFAYDNTNAVAAYLLYAQNLAQTGHQPAAGKIAKQLLEQVKATNQVHIRTAALKLLNEVSATEGNTYLLAALNDPQFQYRAAAIQFALPSLTDETANLWAKQINKADTLTQVAIIGMLGESKKASVLPRVVKFFKHKNPSVKLAAIQAAAKIGEDRVLADLFKVMAKGNEADINVVTQVILRMKGDGITEKVSAFIPKAKPEVQVALLSVLAARAANDQLNTILALLNNKNDSVRKAAFAALKQTVTQQNLPKLFELVNETSDQTALVHLQDAIIAAVKDSKGSEAAVLQQMESSTTEKKPLFYKILGSIGDVKSLAAVRNAFETGNELTKQAALGALAAWSNASAADELINIARKTNNQSYLKQALTGYLRITRTTANTPEQKLLMYRNAMALAPTVQLKQQILKGLEQAKIINAIIFAGNYLNDADLAQTAANTVMTITLAGKYNGTIIKDLLNKTIQVIKGSDSEYQKEAMRKYLADMGAEEGFVSIFNGKDLTGWKGLVGNPIKRSKMEPAALNAAQLKADAEMVESWKVINGELHFASKGNNIATIKQYGDFEMLVDWKIVDDKKGEGDAGIYLRGTPQVQIWDNARTKVGAQVGSGGLYNNQVNESKPLKVADNKLDEWNSFRILMKGDRVTVYLNGVLVTDNVILENYWDRNLPIFAEEQIELQAHGSPVTYRDIYIREIPRVKPFQLSEQEQKEGYKVLFDGTNMHNWTGNTTDYIIEDGTIAIRPRPGKGSGGNLFTKEEFSDFIFRFEFQLTPGANNGLGIRAPLKGDAAYEGMELQILDNDAPIYKSLHEYQYHGSVYGTIAAKRGFLKPVGEWNYEEVIVKGPKIKVILNGTTILDGDITEARKNGAIDGKKHPGLLRDSGHIGFLGHGSPLQFRNIRVKDLSKK